ncbi:MAG: hypothetical protein ACRD2E_11515 [Terriglobales bacterium]
MTDPLNLDALERLKAAATKGPWTVIGNDHIYSSSDYVAECQATDSTVRGECNAAYIVAACNSLPVLTARVRELEASALIVEEQLETAIAQLTAANEARRWIPVSERVPAEDTWVEVRRTWRTQPPYTVEQWSWWMKEGCASWRPVEALPGEDKKQ